MSDFTNDPRLKPCPLCGGHAHISEVVRTFGPSAYFAACDNQDCRLFEVPGMAHYRNSVDDAVAAWNTRAELVSEPQYDELLRCLENDWDIRASWDGLRKFWCIELTEEGVKLRDATHGTLTAEQVRETVEKHWHDLSAEYDMPEATALPEYSYDWHAIADELNARAERTCHIIEYDEVPYPVCSECGAVQPDDYTVYFCWSCGAKVRDE